MFEEQVITEKQIQIAALECELAHAYYENIQMREAIECLERSLNTLYHIDGGKFETENTTLSYWRDEYRNEPVGKLDLSYKEYLREGNFVRAGEIAEKAGDESAITRDKNSLSEAIEWYKKAKTNLKNEYSAVTRLDSKIGESIDKLRQWKLASYSKSLPFKDQLVQRLLVVQTMKTVNGRREVMNRLERIADNIEVEGSTRLAVHAIVNGCSRYPYGLYKLILAVFHFEDGSQDQIDLEEWLDKI